MVKSRRGTTAPSLFLPQDPPDTPAGDPGRRLSANLPDTVAGDPGRRRCSTRRPQEGSRRQRGGSAAFQNLLRELGMEHAREVEDLLSQNAALRRRLGTLRSTASERDDDSDGSRAVPSACNWVQPHVVDLQEYDAPNRQNSAISVGTAAGDYQDEWHFQRSRGDEPSVSGTSHFRIKPEWLEDMDVERVLVAKQKTAFAEVRSNSRSASAVRHADETANMCLRHLIAYPSSPLRMVWDAVGALLIFYDLFAIPLVLSFNPPENTFTECADWVTMLFWTLNVPASFLVGYVRDGITHMSPKRIAVQYLSTWFAVDLIVVIPDWFFTLAALVRPAEGQPAAESHSMKIVRTLRLLRLMRLLRLFKLRSLVNNLDELIDTEYMSIFANIVKMILLLLVINHYISCIWFVLGDNTHSASWITVHGFDSVDWSYAYFTSFHWAITQFTPASMSVQPQNVVERFFAIAVVVFALVGFSYVVGSISGSLTQLRGMQESFSKQFWTLRRCLKQNRVPLALSARVQRYLEHVWKLKQQNISTDGIPLFSLLSEQLIHELKSEMFVPQLAVHPLFSYVCNTSAVTAGRLANSAISPKALAQNDSVFLPGENATHMSFVCRGMLQYIKVNSFGLEQKEWVDKLEDWIAEPVVWLASWAHLGGLVATVDCDLICLDPVQFFKVIHLSPSVFQCVSSYARRFLAWLNTEPPDMLSDIWQGEDVGEHVRLLMGIEPSAKTSVVSSSMSKKSLRSTRVHIPRRITAIFGGRRPKWTSTYSVSSSIAAMT